MILVNQDSLNSTLPSGSGPTHAQIGRQTRPLFIPPLRWLRASFLRPLPYFSPSESKSPLLSIARRVSRKKYRRAAATPPENLLLIPFSDLLSREAQSVGVVWIQGLGPGFKGVDNPLAEAEQNPASLDKQLPHLFPRQPLHCFGVF